jgi:glycosyltransferase involved in cell wall biosynthesis
VPRAGIVVTPPGTAKPSRLPRRRAARGALEFLCVASVTPRKGHLLLVEALAALVDRPWHCRCIGSTERAADYAAAVRYEIGRRGLKSRIALEGEWPPAHLPEAYATADAFVLPSYHEGYGMALAEALAWGLPAIATTAGAIPETVPASAGLLVPPGDAAALTAALARFLDEPALRARLAAGARDRLRPIRKPRAGGAGAGRETRAERGLVEEARERRRQRRRIARRHQEPRARRHRLGNGAGGGGDRR